MFLYDQNEAGISVDMDQATVAKVHLEYFDACFGVWRQTDHTATIFILAVALDIEYTVEALLLDMYLYLNTIGQTADHHIWAWEVGAEVRVVCIDKK